MTSENIHLPLAIAAQSCLLTCSQALEALCSTTSPEQQLPWPVMHVPAGRNYPRHHCGKGRSVWAIMLSIQVASWHEVIVTIQTLWEFSDRLNMRGQRDMDVMCPVFWEHWVLCFKWLGDIYRMAMFTIGIPLTNRTWEYSRGSW